MLKSVGASKGLAILARQGRLDLSVEWHVVREPWKALFSAAEVARAQQALQQAGG